MADSVRGVVEPSLRVVRRPRRATPAPLPSSPRTVLVAAAAPVDPATAFKTTTGIGFGAVDNAWQDEAWGYYGRVGEFNFYVGWRADSCAGVRLIPSDVGEYGLPTRSIDPDDPQAQKLADMVAAIAGGPLGQSELIRRLAEVLSVVGEAWIAILSTEVTVGGRKVKRDRWVGLSREQISRDSAGGDKTTILLPDGTKHPFKPGVDGVFRVWMPHPQKPWLPDSAVEACLYPLREIAACTAAIQNAAQSRLINNGLLIIPQEVNLPSQSGPVPVGQKASDRPPVQQQLQDLIVATAKQAIKDPTAPAATVPITITAPGEWIKSITHLDIGKNVTAENLETRERAIVRMARGLRVSVERITGIGAANHWNLWGITDQDVQMHVKPLMAVICQAIYDLILRPKLAAEGIDPDRFVLWFDAGGLTEDPDKTDEAQAAYAGGAIKAAALVKHTGLSDDDLFDLESEEGRREWARDTLKRHPELFDKLAALADLPAPGPAAPVIDPAATPAAGPPALPDKSGAQQRREPQTENTPAVAASAAPALAEDTVIGWWAARALELAGKRRVDTRDREQFARLRDVPPHRYHVLLGPVPAADVGRLIRGWDTTLDDGDLLRLGLEPERVRAGVERRVARELTATVIDGQVI